MNRDRALDDLAFMVGCQMMGPDGRRALRMSLLMEMGEEAPGTPELAVLWHEDRLMRGEREPVSVYDRWVLARARDAAERPIFDEHFWRMRRVDLIRAGFDRKEARDVIAAIRLSLGHAPAIENDEGDDNGNLEQQAA
ncbi:hypothetical protein [Tsuneonella suprasediminis]|nr:hypothetical protein [Tsuneonella suprasediminis]